MGLFERYLSILFRYMAVIGLFVLLPLFVIFYLGHKVINIEKEEHISKISEKIENNLRDIESDIIPESFLLKVARGAWFTFNKENQIDKYWDYYNKLCLFLNTKTDLYVFNENGSLITPEYYTVKSRFLAVKLWNVIGGSYKDKVIGEYSK